MVPSLKMPSVDGISPWLSAAENRASKATAGDVRQGERTYTVKVGDTLSTIAKTQLGDASQYRTIFDANGDQLETPEFGRP